MRAIWKRLAPILTLAAAVAATVAATVPSAAPAAPAEGAEFVPGEVVVRFAPGSERAERRASLQAVGARANAAVAGVAGTRLLELPGAEGVARATARLEAREDVAWAEPNYVLRPRALPNDPLLGLQWGVRNVGQNSRPIGEAEPVFGVPGIDVDVEGAWDRTTGGGGPVAIVDTGIDPTHPDLAAALDRSLSRNFVATPGFGPDPPVDPGAWADVHGHGTHVAGIVAATGDNGIGVTGVSWSGSVAALRACTPAGECSSTDVAAALAHAGEAGIPVANLSLGSDATEPGDEVLVLREAIAANPQTLYVAAAGNGDDLGRGYDVDEHPEYPCSFDLANIVCVAALASDGELTPFSNWGAHSVDLAAPGEYIESTFVRRLEPFADFFEEGIDGWEQAPYAWQEGEIDEEPALSFHGLDEGVESPVAEASATLATGFDLAEGRSCWAGIGLSLELHGDQTLTIEAAAGGEPAAPLPPQIYDASTLPAGEPVDVAAYLDELEGADDVRLSFAYRANGTETPLPSIDIGSVDVRCIAPSLPLGAYQPLSGTSMATPMVAGVASLGRSLALGTGSAALRQALLASTVPTASVFGKTATGGRVSAARLLDTLAPPAAPAPPPPRIGPRLGEPRVAPRRLRMTPGQVRWLRAGVASVGDAAVRRLRLCLRVPRRQVIGGKCSKPRTLAPGRQATVRFRVRLRPRARPELTHRLRLVSFARGLPSQRTAVPLRSPVRRATSTRHGR